MEKISELLAQATKKIFNEEIFVKLTRPEEQFGDYSSNIALQLSKKLGRPPRDIAEVIVANLRSDPALAKIEVAGPGFINITLSDEELLVLVKNAPTDKPKTYQGKVVVVEYSDPNPFKILHAGHLYTTIVGDVIACLLEYAGATVHRLNYGGDVGLHVGKTMWAITEFLGGELPEKLDAIKPQERSQWVSDRYVEGNTAYETGEPAKQTIIDINKRVYELHVAKDHDSDFAKIYWTCRKWSYDGFDQLYEKLGIKSFEKYVSESEVTPLGLEITKKGLEQGIFEESDGAIVFRGEPHGLHTRVFINSNGLPTYEAKDLGLAATKWQDYKFDLGIIITANDIVEYMKVVLQALSNFYPEVAKRSKHITHGMIKLPGGAKMSSRKGNILLASDILAAAEEANRATGHGNNYEVVLAAVKYAFVKQRIGGDIVYHPDESVSLQGNSGPYLQYAHARACSILAKVKSTDETEHQFEPLERSLARKISEYPEVVALSVNELMPHHIANYLYELAQVFNRFYEKNRVLEDAREDIRVKLVRAYADTLKDGLELLNIHAPDKM